MKKGTYKRINITLPESTVAMLDTVADKGSRSAFIDQAIRMQLKSVKQESLRERLKAGAIARGARDLSISEEWFDVEEELWRK
jgi:CopG family transcriptional regulator/antitoxin EndoAI